jgi:poly-gamma-glutamate synthesis protein (capsule biosynthesis protein)
MELIIAGDLVPTKSNFELFNSANISELLGDELMALWNDVDFRVFNLEVPLCEKETPISKYGPNLIAPLNVISGIKALNPSLIGLANNHIMDQGVNGLHSTIKILEENGIPFIGAGDNLDKARETFVLEKEGKKIGVYACAEYEFSIVTNIKPGANPFDPLESLDHINNLKSKCDYVIVLYHGGKEQYRYPSPYLQKVCRRIVDKGADIVICQHSHCIGSYEQYDSSTIVYGQGNFIFDYLSNEYWDSSLLLKIKIEDDFEIEYIPIVKSNNVMRIANKEEADSILLDFNNRSHEIIRNGFVEENYAKFAKKYRDSYLRSLAGFGRFLSALDHRILKGFLIKRKYSKKRLLQIQNFVECEAHRELLLTSIDGTK